jgi:hypothetical protein
MGIKKNAPLRGENKKPSCKVLNTPTGFHSIAGDCKGTVNEFT